MFLLYLPLKSLPFFPEIRKSQALGRLVFPPLSQAGYNQDHNGDHIGKGLEYLLSAPVQARYIQVKDVQAAKQDRTPNGIDRFHRAKITRAIASQPLSPNPLLVQVPPEYSITKYNPPRPLIPPPRQVARYL